MAESSAGEELDAEIEAFLEERFLDNLSILETEGQLRLNAFVREQALLQVKLYWAKLKDLALRVTQSEVPISLSNLKTEEGRSYTIQGVADIVEEGDKNILYDIKTHDPDFVRHNIGRYEAQLNIYAKVWAERSGSAIDGTAVIATPVPGKLRYAIQDGEPEKIARALEEWNPVIPVTSDDSGVQKTLDEFSKTVDAIESCRFDPAPLSELEASFSGTSTFGRQVCRNCDIRFACDSYRAYALRQRRLSTDDLLELLRDLGDDKDAQAFKTLSFAEDEDKAFEESATEEFKS
jgi:hypothetical protein